MIKVLATTAAVLTEETKQLIVLHLDKIEKEFGVVFSEPDYIVDRESGSFVWKLTFEDMPDNSLELEVHISERFTTFTCVFK